jgi:hypothetical protein
LMIRFQSILPLALSPSKGVFRVHRRTALPPKAWTKIHLSLDCQEGAF